MTEDSPAKAEEVVSVIHIVQLFSNTAMLTQTSFQTAQQAFDLITAYRKAVPQFAIVTFTIETRYTPQESF